jgi:hypothetical protein
MGSSFIFFSTSRWWMGNIYYRRTTVLNQLNPTDNPFLVKKETSKKLGPEKEHHNGSKK